MGYTISISVFFPIVNLPKWKFLPAYSLDFVFFSQIQEKDRTFVRSWFLFSFAGKKSFQIHIVVVLHGSQSVLFQNNFRQIDVIDGGNSHDIV